MKKLFVPLAVFFLLLAVTPVNSAERHEAKGMYPRPSLENPKYYVCKENKNCTTATMPCGRVVILNSAFEKEVQGWSDFVSPRFQCLATAGRQKAENIACVQGVCKGDITPVQTKLEDTPIHRNPAYCESIDDCAVVLGPCYKKIVVNKIYQEQLQRDYDHAREINMEKCFFPDNRTVERLHCEEHTCKADLKIPDETYWNKPVDMRQVPRHE